MIKTDALIIGAGPTGLFTAHQLKLIGLLEIIYRKVNQNPSKLIMHLKKENVYCQNTNQLLDF